MDKQTVMLLASSILFILAVVITASHNEEAENFRIAPTPLPAVPTLWT